MTNSSLHKGIYNCPNCGAAAAPESVRCAYCTSTLATAVCGSCYGAIFIGMKHCPWCGSASAAGDAASGSVFQCPRCDVALARITPGGRAMQECTRCGGLWVGRDTLEEICADQERQEAVMNFDFAPGTISGQLSPERVYIPCPECGKLMNRSNFASCSGVVIDWCKAHGSWFDHNELKQIVAFVRGGGLHKARAREQDRLEETRRHLKEEQRNLARIARLGGDSGWSLSATEEPEPVLDLFSLIWKTLRK